LGGGTHAVGGIVEYYPLIHTTTFAQKKSESGFFVRKLIGIRWKLIGRGWYLPDDAVEKQITKNNYKSSTTIF